MADATDAEAAGRPQVKLVRDADHLARARKTVEARHNSDAVQLLRTTQTVQYQLSQMADQKANMLLGVTFLIFTITVAQLRNGPVHLPLLVLGGAAFLSALLAILAVLPAIKTPPPPAEGAIANMVFFGSFTQLDEEEYVARLLELAADNVAVYEAFAHDIYQNGRVLARKKYRLLGYAYRVLLAGLVGSGLAFAVPYLLAPF
jgi:hypothetical protein